MNSYNLINANIITLDDAFPASSITISRGKIESINKINNEYKSIDLDGATVISGFIDAHYHLKNYGKRLNQLDLKNIFKENEIVNLINQKIKTSNNKVY